MTKKALLIGLNYKKTQCSLDGCWNDVDNAARVVSDKGYRCQILKDNGQDVLAADILTALTALVAGARRGDCLYFHFSGHGGQIPDRDNDEHDGMDETIYDSSLKAITDDQLFKTLVEPLPAGVALVCVLDCCHSGTGIDLPWSYLGSGSCRTSRKEVKADVKLLAACTDRQTAADTSFENLPQGAMTHYFLEAIKNPSPRSWKQLILDIRVLMSKGNYSQYPQLSYSVYNGEKAGVVL